MSQPGSVGQPGQQPVGNGAGLLRQQLLVVVLVAAIAELLLLRFSLRLGPALPAGVNVLPAFALVEWAGVLALNVGVLAACALLLLTAAAAWRRGPAGVLLAAGLAASVPVNLGLFMLVPSLPDISVRLLHLAASSLAICAVLLALAGPMRLRLSLALVGLVQLLALGLGPLALAEAGAVMAAIALPWLLGLRPARRDVVIGGAAGLAVTLAATVQPWGIATVAIWTLGFSLFLPPILYGAAAMSAVLTVPSLRRQPGGGALAAGLVLVWLAGLKLDISSFALMALAGLTIASGLAGPSAPETPDDVSAASLPGWQAMEGLRRRLA